MSKTTAKPTEKPQAELPQGYPVLAPETVSVSHQGVIYTVQDGRVQCPPEVAAELRAAGVLQ